MALQRDRSSANRQQPVARRSLTAKPRSVARKMRCGAQPAAASGAVARKAAKRPATRRAFAATETRAKPTAASGAKQRDRNAVAASGAIAKKIRKGRIGSQAREERAEEIDLRILVGDVRETDAEHLTRHPVSDRMWLQKCLRCAWIRKKSHWSQISFMKVPTRIAHCTTWLAPKPAFASGTWGLGCCVCAAAACTQELQSKRNRARATGIDYRRLSRIDTKWTNYEQRRFPCFLTDAMSKHASTALHREAVDIMCRPEVHLLAGKDALRSVGTAAGGADNDGAACSASNEDGAACSASMADGAACSASWSFSEANIAGKCLGAGDGSAQRRLDIFGGRVPQVQDWVEAWADFTSFCSVRKQCSMALKRGERCRRNQRRKMLAIQAETARSRTRKRVREATSLTIAVDECAARKVLRVCGDMPTAPFTFQGILGMVHLSFENATLAQEPSLQEVEQEIIEDHAIHSLKAVQECVRRFCTTNIAKPAKAKAKPTAKVATRSGAPGPAASSAARAASGAARLAASGAAGGKAAASGVAGAVRKAAASGVAGAAASGANGDANVFDEELFNHIVKITRILAADGASSERRACFLACRRFFTNCRSVVRDPAHAIRIAIQKPMQLEEVFGHVYTELMDKKHALIPDIQNSPKMKRMLQAIESNCLRIPALSREGALRVVLRHFSFARQRFESSADPLAKFCLLLMPVCLLLSFKSNDQRCKKEERDRAATMLANFKPKFLLAAGIAADFGLITTRFLRLFDKARHDVANSMDELEEFSDTINACFIENRILCPLPRPARESEAARGASQHGQPVAPPRQTAASSSGAGGARPSEAARGAPEAGAAEVIPPAAFITERVRKQMRTQCVFTCGDKPLVIWGQCSAADMQDLAQRSRFSAKLMLDRVQAEFQGLRRAFSFLVSSV